MYRAVLWSLVLVKVAVCVLYSDMWAVQIDGGEEMAKDLARRHGFVYQNEIMPGFYQFRHHHVSKRSTRKTDHYERELATEPKVHWMQQQVIKSRQKRSPASMYFSDPEWPKMWYLNRGHGSDMNVQEAWLRGYTGRGVVVSILDDGIETDHPDLARNYDPLASYDINAHDHDPTPRYNSINENRHGTRCAGEVAAMADNHVCGLGVAFDARIGGVRMLDGDVTDSVEAASLSFNRDHIDIYSASWGPDDDGMTVDGPNYLARKAFFDGVRKGRGGKGSIFVWASGNGGREGDNCNCDGYTNSIYTLSISSTTDGGMVPWYSEACASTLASTYSSGSGTERQVITTDLRKGCTETHTGTSASAPLAAGIVALTLQANPSLTWRDLQHIVVRTANPRNLHAYDWTTNGVGRNVSHSFGYGIMDAGNMVDLALRWASVPQQHVCEAFAPILQQNRHVPVGGNIMVHLAADGCRGLANHVAYLEHVVVKLTIQAKRRGEVQVFLVSPMGTRSTLLSKRKNDMSRDGFSNWSFMSTHYWGEPSNGTWTLEVENGDDSFRPIRLRDWSIVMYGTSTHPQPDYAPSTPRDTQAPPTQAPPTEYLVPTAKKLNTCTPETIKTNEEVRTKETVKGKEKVRAREEVKEETREKVRVKEEIEEVKEMKKMEMDDGRAENRAANNISGELAKWSLLLTGTNSNYEESPRQSVISRAHLASPQWSPFLIVCCSILYLLMDLKLCTFRAEHGRESGPGRLVFDKRGGLKS